MVASSKNIFKISSLKYSSICFFCHSTFKYYSKCMPREGYVSAHINIIFNNRCLSQGWQLGGQGQIKRGIKPCSIQYCLILLNNYNLLWCLKMVCIAGWCPRLLLRHFCLNFVFFVFFDNFWESRPYFCHPMRANSGTEDKYLLKPCRVIFSHAIFCYVMSLFAKSWTERMFSPQSR